MVNTKWKEVPGGRVKRWKGRAGEGQWRMSGPKHYRKDLRRVRRQKIKRALQPANWAYREFYLTFRAWADGRPIGRKWKIRKCPSPWEDANLDLEANDAAWWW